MSHVSNEIESARTSETRLLREELDVGLVAAQLQGADRLCAKHRLAVLREVLRGHLHLVDEAPRDVALDVARDPFAVLAV